MVDEQEEIDTEVTEEISEEDRLASLKDDEPETEEKEEKKDSKDSDKKETKSADEKTKDAKAEIKRLAEDDLDKVVTLKINGETKEMSVREAIKLTQLEQASRAKMQEAAQYKKQMEQLVGLAKQDPKQFFSLLGVDPYEFAESTLAEKLELLEMSDEQRKLLEAEEKLKKYEETEKEMKARQEREQEEAAIAQESEKLDKEIGEAWKASGLPMRKEFVTAIAQEMYGASVRKENLTATEAASRVKESWLRSLTETVKSMDAEAIHGILGSDTIEKLRDFDIQRVTKKNMASQKFSGPSNKQASQSNRKSKPLTEQEYEAWKESLYGEF
jgi:hypothetical protein